MAAIELHKVSTREKLKPRHEPYWVRLDRGAHLGYRKVATSSPGTWVAKYRDGDSSKRTVKALGAFLELPENERYAAAKKAAEVWLVHMGAGGRSDDATVEQACANYVQHLRDTGRPDSAKDAEARFRRWINGTRLGSTSLQKLRAPALEAWRASLIKTPAIKQDTRKPGTQVRSASSVNRDMTALRAALNRALEDGYIATDAAWKTRLRPIANADKRRDVYLDPSQRALLISKCAPDLAAFLRALSMLPLRPGAMANLTVGDFDRRLSTLKVGKDKAGRDRKLKLPPAISSFLAEQSKDKLPSAPLLTRADGVAWTKDSWKKPVKAAMQAAGLPDRGTAYALRHSAITDLLSRHKLDTATVAALSGTSLAMIERHYSHLLTDHGAAALAQLVI